MRYRIRFRRRAKEELARAKKMYGKKFSHDCDEWLIEIAEASCREDRTMSINFQDFLEEGLESVNRPSRWKLAWRKWWKLTPVAKVKALLTILKKRCSPWESRETSTHFTEILGVFDCEVFAFFEVDHVEGEVIFTMFNGLPGEPT